MNVKKLIRGLRKGVVCLFLLLILVVLWAIQFLLFLPFLLITFFVPRKTGTRRRRSQYISTPLSKTIKDPLPFNRTNDISKIYGCNTRNVKYRWNVFYNSIKALEFKSVSDRILTALDFGAGSLIDTYELAKLDFRVCSIDINAQALRTYQQFYDWSSVKFAPKIEDISLFALKKDLKFDLIIAFDVLEHLHSLEDSLVELHNRLTTEGILLVTVPNRRSILERYGLKLHKKRIRRNLPENLSGVPHVQFKTPREWQDLFIKKGFKIANHDMTIGFLVNNAWHGFYSLIIRRSIEPFVANVAQNLKISYNYYSLEKLFYPAWLMERVNLIDLAIKPLLRHRWGWSLFVLSR